MKRDFTIKSIQACSLKKLHNLKRLKPPDGERRIYGTISQKSQENHEVEMNTISD